MGSGAGGLSMPDDGLEVRAADPTAVPRIAGVTLTLTIDAGRWNAYVAAGTDRDDRRARLAECPPALSAEVRGHLHTIAQIAARHADPFFRAWAAQVRADEAAARRAASTPEHAQ